MARLPGSVQGVVVQMTMDGVLLRKDSRSSGWSSETPVTGIFSWFRKRGHTHLIVTDAEGSVLGVITSFDLLSAISPTIGIGSGRKYLSLDRLIKSNARVAGDLMAPVPVIMHGTEPLVRALEMPPEGGYVEAVVPGSFVFGDILRPLALRMGGGVDLVLSTGPGGHRQADKVLARMRQRMAVLSAKAWDLDARPEAAASPLPVGERSGEGF